MEKFDYKVGDIIIKHKKFYEPRHMMIVIDVRPKKQEVVVSHLTYGGLQLYTFHKNKSAIVKDDPNQKVIRWKGSKKIIKRLLDVIKKLHTFEHKIEYNRAATVSSFFTPCYTRDNIKINNGNLEKLFIESELFCSNYVTLVWKYVLEEFNLDDISFPMNPFSCYPEQVYDVLSTIPTYWDIFLLKTSRTMEYRLGPKKTKSPKKTTKSPKKTTKSPKKTKTNHK